MRAASTTYLKAGAKVTTDDLLHLTLIASDNAAARALARVSPLGMSGFIARMNTKAQDLGLTSTKYVDPSGLYAANVSSAYDMARLIAYVSSDDRIASVMRKQYHSLPVGTQNRPGAQHQPAGDEGRRRRAGRQDRLHPQRRATVSRRCCGCRRAGRRWRWSSSARSRTPAASGNASPVLVDVEQGGRTPRRHAAAAARPASSRFAAS